MNKNTKRKKLTYRIILRKEPEGGYTVIIPSLPGCITYGKNIKGAYSMAEEAILAYLESQMKHGETIIDDITK
jgi:predicted RNase H-like HicB family nuclease